MAEGEAEDLREGGLAEISDPGTVREPHSGDSGEPILESRRSGVDVDPGDSRTTLDRSELAESETEEDGRSWPSLGLTDRLRARVFSLVSLRPFLTGAGLSVGGVLLIGGLLPLGGLGDLVGVAGGTFLYGLLGRESHYLEVGLAGGAVAGTWALLGNLILTLVGVGTPVVAFGLAGGAVAATLGHYFGRDLRHGLTREV